ncbi:hypothetical protein SMICM17S_06884 [Streptomyces microflavus]
MVCLQELTLSPYFAVVRRADHPAPAEPEELLTGPTFTFAAEAAREYGLYVHASLYEKAPGPSGDDGLGYNTAILVAPDGTLAQRTRKTHIPVTEGYYEVTGSAPALRVTTPSRWSRSTRPASAGRSAGTSGSRSWRAPTPWPVPTSSSTRRPSARSPASPASTPSRSGRR